MKLNFAAILRFAAGKPEEVPMPPVNWIEKDNTLYRKIEFKNFSAAFAFMTRVALEAHRMDHHPKWTNVYNTVEFWLSTHDAGDKVTEKDHQLAKRIDAVI